MLFFVTDLAAIRKILENETGGTSCPSCKMPFDKGKKRKLIDTCGHEICYMCMFKNESCTICINTQRQHRMQEVQQQRGSEGSSVAGKSWNALDYTRLNPTAEKKWFRGMALKIFYAFREIAKKKKEKKKFHVTTSTFINFMPISILYDHMKIKFNAWMLYNCIISPEIHWCD